MVVGTYDGRVIFFSTDQLKYHTTIHVQSSRSKNGRGRKVTGIEAMPGEDRILITSNDSRIRLYDLRDLSLVCKYKVTLAPAVVSMLSPAMLQGYTNVSSQIKACFSPDGRYVTSGSENQCVYLWSTNHVPQVQNPRYNTQSTHTFANYYCLIQKPHNYCGLSLPICLPKTKYGRIFILVNIM